MSKVTIYKCDKCGKENTDPDELKLITIGVGIKSISYSSNYRDQGFNLYDPLRREMEVCNICLEKLGFVHKKVNEYTEIEQPYPSLEDMVREIIREEIQNI